MRGGARSCELRARVDHHRAYGHSPESGRAGPEIPTGPDARQHCGQDTSNYRPAPAAALSALGTFECTSISTYSHGARRTPTHAGADSPSGKAHFHRGIRRLSIPRGASPIRLRVPFPAESEERRKTRGPPDALGGPLVSVVYGEKYTYMSECTGLETAK